MIELVVVLAIIGILLALLLPALNRAVGNARKVRCLNNIRQLGIGFQQYASEHGFYPLAVDAEYSNGGGFDYLRTWETEIRGYVDRDDQTSSPGRQNRSVWDCPGVSSRGVLEESFQSYGYNAYGIGISTNSLGLGGHYGFTNFKKVGMLPVVKPPVPESEVASPSNMMAMGDGFHGTGDSLYSGQSLFWRHDNYPGFSDATSPEGRHLARSNVLFVDGHIESPKLEELFEDMTDGALSRWNRDNLPHRELLSP